MGREVLEAQDGSTAVACIFQQKPQLVLLDLGLASPAPKKCPVFDGYSVLRWINRIDPGNRVPVIIVSSTEASAAKARTLDLGACAYLEKPVDAQSIAKAIRITTDAL